MYYFMGEKSYLHVKHCDRYTKEAAEKKKKISYDNYSRGCLPLHKHFAQKFSKEKVLLDDESYMQKSQ